MEIYITVGEMIAEMRSLHHIREFSDKQMMDWLSQIDARIYKEVLCTHVGDIPQWHPYENMQLPLLIPFSHSDVYRHWLNAKVYLALGDTKRYNNAAELYNTALSEYMDWYNRTHKPLHRANITF